MLDFAPLVGFSLGDGLCCASVALVAAALIAVFLIPELVLFAAAFFTARERIKSLVLTDAGDLVRSRYEKRVADYLYANGVEYVYEPALSMLFRRFRPDFYLRDERVFVELWGMMNDEGYREYMEDKMREYDRMGINYISLFPEDLGNIGSAIEREIGKLRGEKRKRGLFVFERVGPRWAVNAKRWMNKRIWKMFGGKKEIRERGMGDHAYA